MSFGSFRNRIQKEAHSHPRRPSEGRGINSRFRNPPDLQFDLYEDENRVSSEPQPGDLIEFSRSALQHWGVYVGDGDIVHKVAVADDGKGSDSIPSLWFLSDRGMVLKEKLQDVANGDEYRVNNKHDDKYLARSRSNIVQRAEELVGEEISYDLLSNNCEHFANDLRYGVPRSDQLQEMFMDKVDLLKLPMQNPSDMQVYDSNNLDD